MLRLSAAVGVTDNVNAVVELFPVNWSFVIVTPAAEANVTLFPPDCVIVIPVPAVNCTVVSDPAAASKFKSTLLPSVVAPSVYVSPDAVELIVIELVLVCANVISVPPIKVIASFVPSLPAKLMFVVAAGTSTV